MLGECQAVLSVCPPHGALGLAEVVAGSGFAGLYIDANAVAPETALAISARVAAAGATFVDAGIIGPPAARAGTTRFYLSGAAAESAAALFAGSLLEPIVCGVQPGAASAVKMCYAAYTKGVSALLMAIRATAAAHGVAATLSDEWARSQPELNAASETAAVRSAAKAWRFSGEMEQIAETFAAAGLPDGFHRAAGELYDRLAEFKDVPGPVGLPAVIDALTRARVDKAT